MKTNLEETLSQHILRFVDEGVGGIDKVRQLRSLFRDLDKRDPEAVRQFVLRMGKEAASAKSLCAAALLGFIIAEVFYDAYPGHKEGLN